MGVRGSKHDININPAFEVALEANPGGVIISVGSGFGVTEKNLEERYQQTIVTIDPLEEEFAKPQDMSTTKLPMYKTAKEYMDEKKKSDVTMMLDWPSPNHATYGSDAISLLKPLVLVVRYASCGAAGSSRLQSFLGSCGCPHDYSDYTSELDGKYELIYNNQTVIGTGGGFEGKTIDVVVLRRK